MTINFRPAAITHCDIAASTLLIASRLALTAAVDAFKRRSVFASPCPPERAWAALPRGSGPCCPLLATAFWVRIESGLAPSVERSLHADFSEQHRPPIFGGVDQHLYSQTPFRLIAFRFGEPPNIIAGISQCSCRRLTGQRYGLAKWTIPTHRTSLHNGIRSGAGIQRNGPSGG
jgi:hypothetical protein